MTEYAKILLFLIASVLFASFGYGLNYLLAKPKPNPEKNSTYECGEEAMVGSGPQFNMRFYVIGLVFLIFEVEILFLFPWATVFAEKELISAFPQWGIFALAEGILFVGILALGLAYVWKKGDLDWEMPQLPASRIQTNIPDQRYQEVNQRYS